MGSHKRREDIGKTTSATVEPERKPGVSETKNNLSTLPNELQLRIVHYLSRGRLPTICRLNKHWRSVGTDALLRWLLPITPCKTDELVIKQGKALLSSAIIHLIETNNADALQRLLDFRPTHPYFPPATKSLLRAEPVSLRARVTKDEEQRFCRGRLSAFSTHAVDAAFRFNDMSYIQLLIDHGLTDYSDLLHWATVDNVRQDNSSVVWRARPPLDVASRGGYNRVLNWLLTYPPRHVAQAMLVMWGQVEPHPRLHPLCDWCDWTSRDYRGYYVNMLVVAASRGHPASRQMIDEMRMMVEILTDDASGALIPEARQPLSHALRIARGMASMWPGTPPLVAEYLQSVCTWGDHQSSSGGDCSTNNSLPPPPTPPLILPPQDPVLHRLIDLKTYEKMLEPKNWLELQHVEVEQSLLWLVSTEFLSDSDAARQLLCFEKRLHTFLITPESTEDLLIAASSFRRWRCVEALLRKVRGMWYCTVDFCFIPDSVLCRAIIDAVHGEPGCADGLTIYMLLEICISDRGYCRRLDLLGEPNMNGPFRGSRVGWEPLRLAFVEQQQDREMRETQTCMEMRDAVLGNLSISDQDALDFLVCEPSKVLYRASKRRHLKRLADKRAGSLSGGRGMSGWWD